MALLKSSNSTVEHGVNLFSVMTEEEKKSYLGDLETRENNYEEIKEETP